MGVVAIKTATVAGSTPTTAAIPETKTDYPHSTLKSDSFVADKPRMWSDKHLERQVNSLRNFDLAPDGKCIAALMPTTESKEAQEAQNHVFFLMNFLDELRRKVPTGK